MPGIECSDQRVGPDIWYNPGHTHNMETHVSNSVSTQTCQMSSNHELRASNPRHSGLTKSDDWCRAVSRGQGGSEWYHLKLADVYIFSVVADDYKKSWRGLRGGPGTFILSSHWSRVIRWPGHKPLIGQKSSCDLDTGLLLADVDPGPGPWPLSRIMQMSSQLAIPRVSHNPRNPPCVWICVQCVISAHIAAAHPFIHSLCRPICSCHNCDHWLCHVPHPRGYFLSVMCDVWHSPSLPGPCNNHWPLTPAPPHFLSGRRNLFVGQRLVEPGEKSNRMRGSCPEPAQGDEFLSCDRAAMNVMNVI